MSAVAVTAFAACSERIADEPVLAGNPVEVEVSVYDGMTKAADESGEKTVNTLQVFVFGKDNKLEAYKSSEAVSSVKMGIFSGTKIIHALVNAPEVSGVVDYEDFYTATSDLTDNRIDNFVMEGRDTVTVGTKEFSVPIQVSRVVSKVSLVKVEKQLAAMYEGQTLEVISAFLINVAGDRTYSAAGQGIPATPAPVSWYNKMAFVEDDGIAALTHDSIGGVEVGDEAYEVKHNFYCYPNPTVEDNSDAEWSARYTRLVVEVDLGGTVYYYPVSLPGLNQNTEYKVSLCITRPGSGSPDVPYDPDAATVSIEVLDWRKGDDINAVI